jgi:hypothetical protein
VQVDPNYNYFDTGVVLAEQTGWKAYLLNMTSQQWLTTADVDRSIWTHQVRAVSRPYGVRRACGRAGRAVLARSLRPAV